MFGLSPQELLINLVISLMLLGADWWLVCAGKLFKKFQTLNAKTLI